MIYGSVLGSFAVERFGVERLRRLTRQEIDARYCAVQDLVSF
jgi:hypothetical protein